MALVADVKYALLSTSNPTTYIWCLFNLLIIFINKLIIKRTISYTYDLFYLPIELFLIIFFLLEIKKDICLLFNFSFIIFFLFLFYYTKLTLPLLLKLIFLY